MIKHTINYQAKAVLAYLKYYDGLESSWDAGQEKFLAEIEVVEWHNGRERGYVLSLRNQKNEQLNIAFFEHRNGPQICAVAWLQNTYNNPPNINTADFGDIYSNKNDVSITVPYGQAEKMAGEIYLRFDEHWASGAA